METIVVGLSGGVDSAVAALELKQLGFNVIGVFMKNWEEKNEDGVCTSEQDSLDAKAVAAKIGIPFFIINFSKVYEEHVFKEFLEDISLGLTPNPDVLCNSEIKFGPFLDYAKKIGADKIATGHYARVEKEGGVYQLKKCADESKCQTYFLNQLNQTQLGSVMFPLSDTTKKEIRSIAKKFDIPVAEKKDSTGICFIGERNFKNFLKEYFKVQKGKILTINGEVIGEHDGLCFYTIGQKHGLNIGGIKGYDNISWCVAEKKIDTNELIVAPEGSDAVMSKGLACRKFNFTGKSFANEANVRLTGKFRYRQTEQKVIASFVDGGAHVIFDEKQRAVTLGQYCVLYDGENVVGGGKITEVKK